MGQAEFKHRVTVYEIVPGNWTHTCTDEVWGPSLGGKEAATKDANRYREPGEIVWTELSLDIQRRAKKMNVDLNAKAARRDVLGLPEPVYDPFKLSTGREREQ